jgi:uncharacterized protein (TIGR00369 family)
VRAGEAVPMVLSGPEVLFGVGPLRRLENGDLVSGQDLDSRTREPGAGRPELAALGVLVDDVLGYAVNEALSSWSVSTEISVDVPLELPANGRVVCVGRVVHTDSIGALATGEVLTPTGDVVARCTLRGRASGLAPHADVVDQWRERGDVVPPATDLDSLLGPEVVIAPYRSSVAVSDRFVNLLGHLHGGMHLCLLERAATEAVPHLSRTASIRLQMVRGVPLGSELELVSEVLHQGRTLAVVQVRALDRTGRLCSMATVARH